jgi:hypothetical protein
VHAGKKISTWIFQRHDTPNLHLTEELFICGPVHMRWMYPMERYMKFLKDYVRTKARSEGSMAEGYVMDDILGFCTEYMSRYTPTRRRV